MEKRILWIDNNPKQADEFLEALRDDGFAVDFSDSATHGADIITASPDLYFLVIVSLLMYGDTFIVPAKEGIERLESPRGATAGLPLARWIKRHYSALRVICISMKTDSHDAEVLWFKEQGDGYFDKYSLLQSIKPLLNRIRFLATLVKESATLKTYLIHGDDETAKNAVYKYLTNTLRIPHPVIIRESPEFGKREIASFNFTSSDFHAVFVILTSQDPLCESHLDNNQKRKCRQHIFFEMGFFHCLCLQGKGKLFFLHTDELELAGDIPGINYIDISKGLEKGDKLIRQELAEYLPMLRR